MQSPDSIVQQVLQGTTFPTWRVFRGHGSPLMGAIFLGVFTFLSVSICQGVVLGFVLFTGVLNAFGMFSGTTSSDPSLPVPPPPAISGSPNPFDSAPMSNNPLDLFSSSQFGLFWLLPLLVALLIAFLSFKRGQAVRDSLLVITPEGVVRCLHAQRPDLRKYDWLDFATIDTIRLRIQTSDMTSTTTDPTTGAVSSHITGSRTDIWLDVQQSSGPLLRWPVNHTYGRPEAIAQEIIEAFTRFRVTQNNGYLC